MVYDTDSQKWIDANFEKMIKALDDSQQRTSNKNKPIGVG